MERKWREERGVRGGEGKARGWEGGGEGLGVTGG